MKTPPLMPSGSNDGFGSLLRELELVPHAGSIAPPWRCLFLAKGRRAGSCTNRNGEHVTCSRKVCPLRGRNDTHWSREISRASTGSFSICLKAGWVMASQERDRKEGEGERGRDGHRRG